MLFLLVLSVVSLIRTFARGFTSIKLSDVKLNSRKQDWHFFLRVIDHFDTELMCVLSVGASFAGLSFSILRLNCY